MLNDDTVMLNLRNGKHRGTRGMIDEGREVTRFRFQVTIAWDVQPPIPRKRRVS